MPRTAEVQRDAAIGEASANRDAGIKAAQAEQIRMCAKYANDTEVAKSQRDYELKQALYDAEVNTRVRVSKLGLLQTECKVCLMLESTIRVGISTTGSQN